MNKFNVGQKIIYIDKEGFEHQGLIGGISINMQLQFLSGKTSIDEYAFWLHNLDIPASELMKNVGYYVTFENVVQFYNPEVVRNARAPIELTKEQLDEYGQNAQYFAKWIPECCLKPINEPIPDSVPEEWTP